MKKRQISAIFMLFLKLIAITGKWRFCQFISRKPPTSRRHKGLARGKITLPDGNTKSGRVIETMATSQAFFVLQEPGVPAVNDREKHLLLANAC